MKKSSYSVLWIVVGMMGLTVQPAQLLADNQLTQRIVPKMASKKDPCPCEAGPRGPRGRRGARGPAGPQGEQGIPGPAGSGARLSGYEMTDVQGELNGTSVVSITGECPNDKRAISGGYALPPANAHRISIIQALPQAFGFRLIVKGTDEDVLGTVIVTTVCAYVGN